MKSKINFQIIVFAAIAAVLLVSGCTEGARVGELQTRSETVELGSEESVNVDIELGAGELVVGGGAADLLDATFTYNVEELEPEVTYSGGRLVVSHGDARGGIGTFLDLNEFRNEWDLSLNEDVPMDLRVDVGAGRSELTLGDLNLESLDVNAGAGDVSVDLSGTQSLSRLDFTMGAGEVDIDLSGDWQDDLNASISGGVGELTVTLPGAVGVRVTIDTGIGDIDTSGLTKDGDTYTNAAYGESEVTLDVDIDAGVGRINLRAGE